VAGEAIACVTESGERSKCAMKNDALFYEFFSSDPALVFALLGEPSVSGYCFDAVEMKEAAFRMDGLLLPPANRPDLPIIVAEVQFQEEETLYSGAFCEVLQYVHRHPEVQQWRLLFVFGSRGLEPERTKPFEPLLNSSWVRQIYLDELGDLDAIAPGLGLLKLTLATREQLPEQARQVLARADRDPELSAEVIIGLVLRLMGQRFTALSLREIEQMLRITEADMQTQLFKDIKALGQLEGELSMVLRLLEHRLGTLPAEARSRVESLDLEHLEALGIALLDFGAIADLETWLDEHF